MWKRFAFSGAAIVVAAVGIPSPAQAVLDSVEVCAGFGAGYYEIPGTGTCVNADTGETLRDTGNGIEYGETDLARRVREAEHQSAISNALEEPDLATGEQFGLRMNWGAAGNENALGITGTVVISHGANAAGRVSASGGVAFSGDQMGGRIGLKVNW